MTNHDPKPLLRFPVYEPAGRDVEMTEQDLLQHLLIIGATGSGKTSLLHRLIAQLIPHKDTGLLIFDAKQDDTVERVRRLATACGREVIVLGPRGGHYLDLFAPLQSLADVDLMTQRLLAGTGSMGTDNAYWDETRHAMIDAALTLLAARREPVNFAGAMGLMREWFFGSGTSPKVRQATEELSLSLEDADFAEAQKIGQTLDTISLWQNFDQRTRSSVQSTLINALRPLLSVPASRCFESIQRPPFNLADVATRGAVCVVSLNATVAPSLASLFFKLAKGDFFRAVQQQDGNHHLCGVVADELPLLVTAEDVEALATVRSRRCFLAAATQGLAALDERLGPRRRNTLLANFGSVCFLRSREEEVDHFAAIHLGTREQVQTLNLPVEEGSLLSLVPRKLRQQVLVCPPGTLGRLQPHQGFVASPHPDRPTQPLWFVPWFEESPEVAPTPLRCTDPTTMARLDWLMEQHGFRERLNAETMADFLKARLKPEAREPILTAATSFFRSRAVLVPQGLDTLPTAWLKALPGILCSLRHPHWVQLPYMICETRLRDGMLQLRFALESLREPGDEQRLSSFDRVRIAVNAALYPNRWRPLKRKHALRLGVPSPATAPPLI